MNISFFCHLCAAVFLMLQCSACAPTSSQPSGFLGSPEFYSTMRPDPEAQGVLVYRNPAFSEARFSSSIVPPVSVFLNDTGKGRGFESREIQGLGDDFRRAVIRNLGSHYSVMNAPAANVAVLRLAITDANRNKALLNFNPGGLLLGTGLGGATAEAEIIDSVSGERIAAYIATGTGKRADYASGLTRWGHTKDMLDEWAELIGRKVGRAAPGY